MISYYGRKGKYEELLLVPSNFYIYTCGLNTVYCADPNVLSGIDKLLRNGLEEEGLGNNDWGVYKIKIPNKQLKKFRKLCFSGRSDELIFKKIMEMFNHVVRKLDYVLMDFEGYNGTSFF